MKIETGCFAVIRETGQPVLVGKRHQCPGCSATFAVSFYGEDMGEYMASELKRISAEEFCRLDDGDMERQLENFDKIIKL
jgi:hypothetical protein